MRSVFRKQLSSAELKNYTKSYYAKEDNSQPIVKHVLIVPSLAHYSKITVGG